MKTIVYVIRHGETDWNLQGKWQGHVDIPLNKRGNRQSHLLAQRLRASGVKFHAIYSSDLARAYQTAWAVGSAMQVAVELLPPLREIDLGYWSGLTRDEIRERYPEEYTRLSRGEDIARGGGETLALLYKRVSSTVEALTIQHPGETLAFFTHGGSVRMILSHVCKEFDRYKLPCPHIGNTSINIIHYTFETRTWTLDSCNDMKHLQNNEPGLASSPPDDAERPDSPNRPITIA